MKIKNKFTMYNLIMLIASIVIVGVISVCFLAAFVLKFPVEQMYITRASLINPVILGRAVGEFFRTNPSAIGYFLLWGVMCVAVVAVTSFISTSLLSKRLVSTIDDLADAADKIRGGNLSFEIMGSDYDEIDNLCASFEDMRRHLQYSEERTKRMTHERNMLLANISHDLKTPVTSIKGYIDGIRDGIADTPEKLNRYLDTIYSKAKTIDDMVNNLSAFSKLELSKMQFNFETGDFNRFLSGFLEEYKLDLEKSGMTLETDISVEEAMIKIDYEQLRRVTSNIIDNAIKYKKGAHGRIKVSTSVEDCGVYARFEDDGIGISQKELSKVFEGFYRVDSARSSNVKGSGLGLGIARQIAENHGGKLWLRSDGEGMGTAVTLYLPLL